MCLLPEFNMQNFENNIHCYAIEVCEKLRKDRARHPLPHPSKNIENKNKMCLQR